MKSSWFQRFILPGFAFKAVVIGGGYATGRELATFFMPSGPWGGVLAIVLATIVWSIVCAATFVLAYNTRSTDYRTFFKGLLGRFWWLFEIAFFLGLIVILAVFAASAGAIGQALFGWPTLVGALCLMIAIIAFAALGNEAVEGLFKYVSFFLYGTYAVFLILAFTAFGPEINAAFSTVAPSDGWVTGGLTYAGYNIAGAVIILPVLRHLTSRSDAVSSGLIAGPLAMAPALLFFVCMAAFYPQIADVALPSDFLLERLDFPLFRYIFQAMIFAALLESGVGQVHAINERIAHSFQATRKQPLSARGRLIITTIILAGSVFVADRVGLVALIGEGYRWLAYAILLIFVLPLMTIGLWKIATWKRSGATTEPGAA